MSSTFRPASARVRILELGSEALALLGRNVARVWYLWAATGAVHFAAGVVMMRQGLEPHKPPATAAFIAYDLASSAFLAFADAVALRTLLQTSGRWRIDRGVLAYVAVMTAMCFAPPLEESQALAIGWPGISLSSSGGWAGWAAGFAITADVWFACLRLLLWPVGMLMGRPDITLARSWRLMRGGVVAVVVSVTAFVVLIGVPDVMLENVFGEATIQAYALDSTFNAVVESFWIATIAAVWRTRMRAEDVGEVFA